MRQRLLSIFAVAAISVFTVCAPSSASADAKVGSPAPDFTIKGHDGEEYSLSDLKGKFVVLEWLNPECPYVRKHYNTGNMQNLQRTYTGKGVVWLAVNTSPEGKQGHLTTESAQAFINERNAAPTAITFDHNGETGKAYGAKTTPHMFIINPEGTLIYSGAIDDNDSTREGTVATAKNFVATALDEAMDGKPVTMTRTEPYGCSVKYAA